MTEMHFDILIYIDKTVAQGLRQSLTQLTELI